MNEPRDMFYLNAKAIEHLKFGQYRQAAFMLQNALFHLRDVLHKSGHNRTVPISHEELSFGNEFSEKQRDYCSCNETIQTAVLEKQQRFSGKSLMLSPIALMGKIPSGNNEELICYSPTTFSSSLLSHDHTFAFFNQAFQTSIDHNNGKIEQVLSKKQKNLVAMILLFNVGVLHHNKGLLSGNSSELVQALRFYKQVVSVIEEFRYEMELHDDDRDDNNIMNILIAVFNNIGHIHSYFFNIDKARQCLAMLQEFVKLRSGMTYLEDNYFFFLVMFATPEHSFATAPAA